jgi:hypothetical protein
MGSAVGRCKVCTSFWVFASHSCRWRSGSCPADEPAGPGVRPENRRSISAATAVCYGAVRWSDHELCRTKWRKCTFDADEGVSVPPRGPKSLALPTGVVHSYTAIRAWSKGGQPVGPACRAGPCCTGPAASGTYNVSPACGDWSTMAQTKRRVGVLMSKARSYAVIGILALLAVGACDRPTEKTTGGPIGLRHSEKITLTS